MLESISYVHDDCMYNELLIKRRHYDKIMEIIMEICYTVHVHLFSSVTSPFSSLPDVCIIIAIESRQHTGLTLRLIEKEKDILEKGMVIVLVSLGKGYFRERYGYMRC